MDHVADQNPFSSDSGRNSSTFICQMSISSTGQPSCLLPSQRILKPLSSSKSTPWKGKV